MNHLGLVVSLTFSHSGYSFGSPLFRLPSSRAHHDSAVSLDKLKCCAILALLIQRGGRVKYPVSSSLRHKGKTLDLDANREVITLLGINGEPMGNLSWDFVIDQISGLP